MRRQKEKLATNNLEEAKLKVWTAFGEQMEKKKEKIPVVDEPMSAEERRSKLEIDREGMLMQARRFKLECMRFFHEVGPDRAREMANLVNTLMDLS